MQIIVLVSPLSLSYVCCIYHRCLARDSQVCLLLRLLNYFPLNFSGDGVLGSAVQYNGQTFAAGDTLHASLKADVFDASLTYYMVNMDDLPSRLQLGVEAAVKLVRATTTMQDRTTGVTQSVSTTLPMPTLGARGRVAISDFIGLTGRAGYLSFAGNHFLDSEMQVEFSPLPTVGLYAGYRLIETQPTHHRSKV